MVQRQASPKNSIAFGFIVILAPVAITIKPSTNSAPTMIRIKLSLKKCSKAVKKAPCLEDKMYGSKGNPAS